MHHSIAALAEQFGRMNDRMLRLETILSGSASCGPFRHAPTPENDSISSRSRPILQAGESDFPYYSPVGPSGPLVTPADRPVMQVVAEDEMETEPGPPVPPGGPAIPMNHTTLAGLLLQWSCIRELTQHQVERAGIRHVSEYPIWQEQNRGLLLVHGRGEDSQPARSTRETRDHGQIDLASEPSEIASPCLAADWGNLGGLSPSDQVEYVGGVLGPGGNPDFTESKVWTYVESFKENIMNMHPLFRFKILDEWVQHFLNSLPVIVAKPPKHQTSRPAFAVGTGTYTPTDMMGLKSKRSPGPDLCDASSAAGTLRTGRPDRSIHSALILTVLALGKICLFRDYVPDALHADGPPPGSPSSRNGLLMSPMEGSPTQSYLSQRSMTSSAEPERLSQSRRSSFHGTGLRGGFHLKKNYEVIPGLEHFALATDILGNNLGGYKSMKAVYANILAGLFHGQLARPIESFAFIHQAGHKLQVIMRPSLDKLRKIKDRGEFITDHKYNQIALAFWSCIQLESDLIAELPLPPSGLLSYEDDMPHPNLSLLNDIEQRILDSFPGQLYLRTHLNTIHRMFYAPHDPAASSQHNESPFNKVEVVNAVADMEWIAPRYAFRECDPPADEILSARLRGKYWGAQVITYRPFVRIILEFNWRQKKLSTNTDVPATAEVPEAAAHPRIAPDARSSRDLDPKLIELARKGINALIESTRSFHGLAEKRPIITNVFGTAHAQWGNLLVLAAAFRDPVLHDCVDEDVLQTLFQGTIRFLHQASTATNSLRTDMLILEGLQQDLFAHRRPRMMPSLPAQATAQMPSTPMGAPLPPAPRQTPTAPNNPLPMPPQAPARNPFSR